MEHEPTVRCEVAARVSNPVSNVSSVTNSVTKSVSNPDSERVKLWRKSFPERYRAYQREYMKRRRMNGSGPGTA